jgi:hypothetical protein
MPRNAATAIENSFIGGFITQATALNFPQNAAFDQDNVVFSERGIVTRRNGFDYENNFTEFTASNTEKAQTTYYWKNAGGDGNVNLVVHQNGDTLYFYNTNAALSLSTGRSANTVTLSSFQSSGSTTDNLNLNECQFSAGLGYLFVVHPYCDPFYVKYNIGAGTFTSSIITFQIRDTIGIEENVLVDNRPATLTANHTYNLINQGWRDRLSTGAGTFYTAAGNTYPSNADVWWIFKDSTDIYAPATTIASNSRGSSPAPRGFFRLNPWNTNRAAVALAQAGVTITLSGIDETSGTLRPSVTEFHSGRVFYTGVNTVGYNSRIYFSKIVQKPADFGSCMSDNDPTSETLFDFLPSDGGIISIPGAGTIFRLISLGPTLLVFGANGVWAISGSQGVGFAATDYTVSSISDDRSISGTSFVVAQGSVAWWNNTGINLITSDPQKGLSVVSMTNEKIKDYFLDLPSNGRRFARGTYNPRTHVIQWLYRQADSASLTETYTFDSVLSFNVLIGAFYTWTIPDSVVDVQSLVTIEGAGSLVGSDNIVDNTATQVVDNLGNNLITYGFTQTTVTTATKYLVYSGGKFSFGECFNVAYLDWTQKIVGGVDYSSFFTTGYRVLTQGERNFQTNYIFVFSDLASGSNSYKFQALWNYGTSGNTGEWTNKQTINQTIAHTETNYDAARRRLKVRGSGTSVQFKFMSVSGLPFNLVGWSTFDTSNAAA